MKVSGGEVAACFVVNRLVDGSRRGTLGRLLNAHTGTDAHMLKTCEILVFGPLQVGLLFSDFPPASIVIINFHVILS